MQEKYNYIGPNEKINPVLILQRMSEAGVCILTGQNEKLTILPVDLDIENILASNMAQISEEIAKNAKVSIGYSASLVPAEPSTNPSTTVKFETIPDFEEYNKSVFNINSLGISEISNKEENASKKLLNMFEFLTSLHLKGILEITIGSHVMNRFQYQHYIMRQLSDLNKKEEPKIHLIK